MGRQGTEQHVYQTEVLGGPGSPPELDLDGAFYTHSSRGVAEEEHRLLVDFILMRYFGPDDGGRTTPFPRKPTDPRP